MSRRAVAILAAIALLAAAPRASADDVTEARARFKKGAELYRAGKWREAIVEFEAAYAAKPSGAIHFNVAQCRERLSEWPAALRSYHDYLHEVPDAKDRATVRAAIGKLEGRLRAAGVQALVVYSDPPGATVTIDGRPRGKTPLHVVVPPGSYPVALALDGHQGVTQEVVLPADASRVVDVVLAPASPTRAPPAAASAAPKRAPELRVLPARPAGEVDLATMMPPAKPAPKRRVYTWIAAGTAVAAATVGGYYGWSAKKDADSVDGFKSDPRVKQVAKDAESKARTANVLYAVSGAAAAAGVTLYFVEKRF